MFTKIKKYFELGIIVKNDKAIAHRSLLKIFLNPLLRRLFGIAIASKVENKKFLGYSFIKQNEPTSWSFKFGEPYDYIKD